MMNTVLSGGSNLFNMQKDASSLPIILLYKINVYLQIYHIPHNNTKLFLGKYI
jgi:hypothetical protein